MTSVRTTSILTLLGAAFSLGGCSELAPPEESSSASLAILMENSYFMSNATGWQPTSASRLVPVVDTPIIDYALNYSVTQAWMVTTGDQANFLTTNVPTGWGSHQDWQTGWIDGPSVPNHNVYVVGTPGNVGRFVGGQAKFTIKYPSLGRYRLVAHNAREAFSITRCPSYYPDRDGDGYGDQTGKSVQVCEGENIPAGYVATAGDCCDRAGTAAEKALSAKIHPGADYQNTSAGGLCGITWDYDCDAQVTPNPAGPLSQNFTCSAAPECNVVWGAFSATMCGEGGPIPSCGLINEDPPACHMAVPNTAQITCR